MQTRLRSVARTVLMDAAVIGTGVVVYFGIRGQTATNVDAAVDHAHDILRLEEQLGLDVEAGVQDLLVDVDAVTTFANWVYIWGHWPVIGVVFLWLALRHRTVFLRLRNAMIASGAMGLCVYTTYPVAPPRLADRGYVDTITEQSNSYRVLQPPGFVNQYAAMPSLHVGWDLLVGLAVIAAGSTVLVRTFGRLMPVLMAAATVVTANHYVLDVIVGAAFGMAGWAVALWIERRREGAAPAAARSTSSAPLPPEPRAPVEDLPGPTADRATVDARCRREAG